MKNFITLVFASLTLMACAGGNFPATAANGPNLLILGEDANQDTIPRGHAAFKRVLDALANEFTHNGYKVYDEPFVTLENSAQGRSRRTVAEITDIAKNVATKKIDIA